MPLQILVHISAPSSCTDDSHYRQQAQSYLTFEKAGPNHNHFQHHKSAAMPSLVPSWEEEPSFTSNDDDEDDGGVCARMVAVESAEDTMTRRTTMREHSLGVRIGRKRPAEEEEEEEEEDNNFGGVSFDSSGTDDDGSGMIGMSRKRMRISDAEEEEEEEEVVSRVSRSANDNHIICRRSLRLSQATTVSGSSRSPPPSLTTTATARDMHDVRILAQRENVRTTTTTTTRARVMQTHGQKDELQRQSGKNAPSNVVSDSQSSSSSSSLAQEGGVQARHVASESQTTPRQAQASNGSSLPSSSSSPSPAPKPSPATTTTAATITTTHIHEIHPPPPPTTSNSHPPSPTSLLTPSLTLLASTLNLPQRFLPTAQTRPLRAFERGHWSVDISPLAADLRRRFWEFLRDFVGRGKAGWSVWVSSSTSTSFSAELVQAGNDDHNDDGGGGDEDGTDTTVSVFCFGALVPHIWLLLWLATERRIKGLQSTWLDAESKVVLLMP